MVFFNHATRQMTTKIVYYGPGLCGKTTNLNTIYGRTSQKARGEMVSLNTETDRTLFFDLLPMDVGMVAGFKTKLQLYTVPGQVFYNSTRKLVLKGVDGIVFVADSQTPMLDANKESLQNLRDNLRELGLDLRDIPLIFQWNKRDLKNIVPVEQLERELNPEAFASIQSIASDGTGVFETLRSITKLALANIKALHLADAGGAKAPAMPVPRIIPRPRWLWSLPPPQWPWSLPQRRTQAFHLRP
jgi:small GTP-binding protein